MSDEHDGRPNENAEEPTIAIDAVTEPHNQETTHEPALSAETASPEGLEQPVEPTLGIPDPINLDSTQPTNRIAAIKEKLQATTALLREKFQTLKASNFRLSPNEIAALATELPKLLQKQGAALYGGIATVLLSTYFLSDVLGLIIDKYIPEPPAPRASYATNTSRNRSPEEYNVIFSRNLFSSLGIIPGETNQGDRPDQGGEPVRSTLPFNLVGTMILRNELRSIATLEDKSENVVYPVRMNDEIPAKLKVLKVETYKVTFINTSNGRREFIDMPQDPALKMNFGIKAAPTTAKASGIEQVSPTQFSVQRTAIDNALKDLNQVLTQARAVPHFENGVAAGFKLFQIVPGSIYDQLGFKEGDLLCGVNGQPMDAAKAFEMLSELKNSNRIEICMKRNGKQSNNTYDIR